MKVKIVKCSKPTYWYKNIIGREFKPDLEKSTETMYYHFYDGYYDLYVNKEDCEVLER